MLTQRSSRLGLAQLVLIIGEHVYLDDSWPRAMPAVLQQLIEMCELIQSTTLLDPNRTNKLKQCVKELGQTIFEINHLNAEEVFLWLWLRCSPALLERLPGCCSAD